MTFYQPPLRDMQLLVEQALAQTGADACPDMKDLDTELTNAVMEEAARFASGVLAPLNSVGDTEGCRFENGQVTTPPGWKEAYRQFCTAGWMGLALPTEYGGQSLPKFIAQPVNEMWLTANLAFVMFQALAQGGSELLLNFGTEEQKQRYLEPIISGRWTVAMALTEPGAGSDLGALKTRAVRQPDGRYLIRGQKIFITYGDHDLSENILHLVLARTPDAPAGSRGISLFAVPKYRILADGTLGQSNDIICTGIEHKTGLHGSPTCSISYGDNDDCYGELIGEESRGLAAMFVLMNEARLSCGMQGVALGELGFQKAQSYALERIQGTSYRDSNQPVPIAKHPDVARMLLSIRSEVMGLRALGYLIAALIDRSESHPDADARELLQSRIALLTPVFKAYATEKTNQLAGTAIQVFGGMGFIEETGIAQLMRDARITTIYEGTTGIQARDLLFRKIRGDSGTALTTLLDDIDKDISRLNRTRGLQAVCSQLYAATQSLRNLLDTILETDESSLLRLNAGATSLLEAIGILGCGWQLGLLASTALARRETDPVYFGNLAALADYFFAHVFPQFSARLQTFARADRGVADYRFGD